MISNGSPTSGVVTVPPGPITLPQSAILLNMGHFHGLGSEDRNQDSLQVCIELKPPITCEPPRNTDIGNQRRKRRRRSGAAKAKEKANGAIPSCLRAAAAIQGAVEFLSLVLQQKHFPETRRNLFDYVKLSQAHVMELGAGTGLLALALSPLVRKYTATDIPALIPLIRKNVLSTSVTVTALDWTLPALRQVDVHDADAPDVLLAHTAAVVVAELRAEDVLREFLQEWIALGWSVWSVGEDLLGARWGMWVAWREM
ncbi:hypothetical protein EI94DRAFT_1745345 [Lactarius quietus]|nr:hypothetical protein EI94DRAFT_1745345 [Lactarius quietus]